MISCSKDSPAKETSKSGIFKMVITTSEPIDPSKSSVSFTFAGLNNNLSVKTLANFSSSDDGNIAIDEDSIAIYGSPVTIKSVAPVNFTTVNVGFGGIQDPAPLKLHLDIYYDDKKMDEKDLTLSDEIKAAMYNFKASGETINY